MKKLILYAVLLLSALAVSPAWAVNKCTGPDGSVVFQDAPCAGRGQVVNVKPASGHARAASGEPAETEAGRIEANVAASQRERRLRELVQRELPAAESAIGRHLKACQDEQDSLQRSKGQYVQNLYGKTDAAQKAAEQAAAAGRCDVKDRDLRAQAQALKTECQKLGGCK